MVFARTGPSNILKLIAVVVVFLSGPVRQGILTARSLLFFVCTGPSTYTDSPAVFYIRTGPSTYTNSTVVVVFFVRSGLSNIFIAR